MRLRSIFLANDSFVFENRVTQREPGMADSQNRGCSSEREFAFRGQGFAVAEVCLHCLIVIMTSLHHRQKSLNSDSSV